MEMQREEMEIDLIELFFYLKKRIIMILAVCVACVVLGFVGTKLFISPEYTANTRMYVLNRTNETGVVSADFTISNNILNDYKVLITGQNVTKEVIKQLELDIKPEELSEMIKVTSPDDTRVLQIAITDNSAQKAADIANCVREMASKQIKEIMDVDAVKTVYEADVPQEPSGPHAVRNAVLVGALGFALVVGVLVVVFIMDDTIRTDEDVARYLGLGTLGVIPASKELETASNMGAVQKKKKKKKRIIVGSTGPVQKK